MISLPEIDRIFDLCLSNTVDAAFLGTVNSIIHLKDIDGNSLLDASIQNKCMHSIEQLLHFDFMPDDDDKTKVLSEAVRTEDPHIVKMILDKIKSTDPDLYGSAFWFACVNGNIEIVRLIFARCPSIHLNGPLQMACINGHAEVARALINAGADAHLVARGSFLSEVLNPWNSHQQTTIDLKPVIDSLIQEKCFIDTQNPKLWEYMGWCGVVSLVDHAISLCTGTGGVGAVNIIACILSALQGACQGGRMTMIKHLLAVCAERRYDVNYSGLIKVGMRACRKEVVDYLLDRYDGDVNIVIVGAGAAAWTGDDILLFYAVLCGSGKLVKHVLDRGQCNVNTVIDASIAPGMNPATALSRAADPSIVKMLLDAKADVNPAGCDTVLKTACEMFKPDAVKALIDAGAAVNGTDIGMPPLYSVLTARCTDNQVDDKIAVLTHLLDAGAKTADVYAGFSALHLCVRAESFTNNLATVKALLGCQPSLLECTDNDGFTPLMTAVNADRKDIDIVKALIDAGADVNARNTKTSVLFLLFTAGMLSFALVANKPKRDILRLLLDAGADPRVPGEDGMTLIMQVKKDIMGNDHACNMLIGDIIKYCPTLATDTDVDAAAGGEPLSKRCKTHE
jgi:ankyrin repeat protein